MADEKTNQEPVKSHDANAEMMNQEEPNEELKTLNKAYFLLPFILPVAGIIAALILFSCSANKEDYTFYYYWALLLLLTVSLALLIILSILYFKSLRNYNEMIHQYKLKNADAMQWKKQLNANTKVRNDDLRHQLINKLTDAIKDENKTTAKTTEEPIPASNNPVKKITENTIETKTINSDNLNKLFNELKDYFK